MMSIEGRSLDGNWLAAEKGQTNVNILMWGIFWCSYFFSVEIAWSWMQSKRAHNTRSQTQWELNLKTIKLELIKETFFNIFCIAFP
jgi:hypothetical protein